MRRGWWGVGGGFVLASGLVALAWAASAPIGGSVAERDSVRPRPSLSAPVRPYPADSLARATVARDVFRVARRPARVTYDPKRAATPAVPETRPPKPVLALVGMVAGAEPTAVVEGFPGVGGARVVRVGDVIAGLRVARIGVTDVRIAGMDTVWVLQVREPWK